MIFREYSATDLIPSSEIFSVSIGCDGRVYIIAEEKADAGKYGLSAGEFRSMIEWE